MSAILQLEDIHVWYGGIHALKGVSLEIAEGEIVTLIGANGAGKSTTLRAIAGLNPPKQGRILYRGAQIDGVDASERVGQGLVLCPEGRRIFSNLTVLENLHIGAYLRKDKAGIKADIDRVMGLFPILGERSGQLSGTLSGGEQQMLAVGRALLSRPKLLLLDEPSLGLAPLIIKQIFATLVELNKQDGLTLMLVEQNAHLALRTAARAYVIETGEITLSGAAAEMLADPKVQEAYLGI